MMTYNVGRRPVMSNTRCDSLQQDCNGAVQNPWPLGVGLSPGVSGVSNTAVDMLAGVCSHKADLYDVNSVPRRGTSTAHEGNIFFKSPQSDLQYS